jgi:hypothetical protein
MNTTYKWFELYNTAVLETDWSQMEARIQAAESAIKKRLHEFSSEHGGTPHENQALVDCLNRINTLRADLASWQESKSADQPTGRG